MRTEGRVRSVTCRLRSISSIFFDDVTWIGTTGSADVDQLGISDACKPYRLKVITPHGTRETGGADLSTGVDEDTQLSAAVRRK